MKKKRTESGDYDWGLFHHRWAIPVLAKLGELGGGAKFVTLQMRLQVRRESLKRTLEALDQMQVVARNPGYGHPMRPEYILTPRGVKRASACKRLFDATERLGVTETALNKWSLPVVYAIGRGGGRFNSIQEVVGAITPRALALALRDVEKAGLVTRELVDDYPPRAEYSLSKPGAALAELTAKLLH